MTSFILSVPSDEYTSVNSPQNFGVNYSLTEVKNEQIRYFSVLAHVDCMFFFYHSKNSNT